MTCRVCGQRAKAKGLCGPCYAYRHKYGKDRPFEVQVRWGELVLAARSRLPRVLR